MSYRWCYGRDIGVNSAQATARQFYEPLTSLDLLRGAGSLDLRRGAESADRLSWRGIAAPLPRKASVNIFVICCDSVRCSVLARRWSSSFRSAAIYAPINTPFLLVIESTCSLIHKDGRTHRARLSKIMITLIERWLTRTRNSGFLTRP